MHGGASPDRAWGRVRDRSALSAPGAGKHRARPPFPAYWRRGGNRLGSEMRCTGQSTAFPPASTFDAGHMVTPRYTEGHRRTKRLTGVPVFLPVTRGLGHFAQRWTWRQSFASLPQRTAASTGSSRRGRSGAVWGVSDVALVISTPPSVTGARIRPGARFYRSWPTLFQASRRPGAWLPPTPARPPQRSGNSQ